MVVKIIVEKFGTTEDGKDVKKFTLENASGMKVSILDYGASINSIVVPDKHGKFADVVLGYETVRDYEQDKCYIGALCGRVANRISNAEFTIDGVTHQVSKNDGENHIHGGHVGFNKKLFQSAVNEERIVEMTYISAEREEGYPGTLTVMAQYQLTDENELLIRLTAVSTSSTPVNLVQHTYFNLAGHEATNIFDHDLVVNAETFTVKKADGYPSGEIAPVSATPFDFRKPRILGDDIEQVDGQVGYDHNLCLNNRESETTVEAAELRHPASGRTLVVKTNQPGLQVYTSYYLGGERGKDRAIYQRYGAICLETQNYPDAINQPNFPDAVLRPEKAYRHEIVYKFSAN